MSAFDDRVRPVREALRRAADELGVRVTLEGAHIADAEGKHHPLVAIVHDFGGGMCLLADMPDKHLEQLVRERGYGWSATWDGDRSYDRDSFVEIFDEWGWTGEGAPPAWHGVAVVHAAFGPNGRLVVTSGPQTYGTARIWEVASGRLLHTLEGHTAWVESVVFSPDGRLVVTAAVDGARIWEAASGRHLRTLEAEVWSAEFSPDSSLVVTADGTARIWETASGRLLHTLEGHRTSVNRGAFSPDGRLVVTAGTEGTARIWETGNGRLQHILETKAHSYLAENPVVWSAVFSPDGRLIVTANSHGTARIWQAASGRLLHTLECRPLSGDVSGAAFSPDSNHVVVDTDQGAQIWDAAAGRLLHTLESPSYSPFNAALSPDGNLVITPYYDGLAQIWEAATGRSLHTLEGDSRSVRDAAFSPDSRMIVIAGSDGAHIWDAASGRLLHTLRPRQTT